MVRVFALSFLALAACFIALSRPARAEPANGKATPVYVLSVWTNDVDDQADALTQALRSRVRLAPGWSLNESSQSFETLSIALRCPPTPNQACLDRIGDQLHADHYIWGTMSKERSGEVTAELRLWTRGKPQVEASESYNDNLKDASDDALRAIAGRLFGRLTNNGGSTGTVVVHAGTGGGSVVVDGAAKGHLKDGVARLSLSEGSHTLVVHVDGFSAPAQTITLADGGDAEVTFALSPAETAQGAEAPAPEAAPSQEEPSKPFPTRKVIGYSVVVVGAGFLIAGGVEAAGWLSDKSDSDQDRTSVPNTVTDVCAGTPVNAAAADACQKSKDAQSAAKLGWIFAAVGAVLAGTGIWLVVADHSGDGASADTTAKAAPPRAKWDVLPAIGPRAGSVDLRLTF
ncbi:MAG TPA: hypothetical protein VHV30_14250 [Polyangiaceae bacterium]|jgi:hypothetical protein|nr:hypothetical protein [Polyangiaceae bacterium]